MIQIHGNQVGVAPSRNDQKVRLYRTITRQKSIHRDSERHVKTATGSHSRQQIVTAQFIQGWVPTDATHTWPSDPQHSPNIILVGST
jgi:hypothetical protein